MLCDANNWGIVASQQNGTNDIDIDATTNQYNNVNGSPLTYDDNGNLVADFYRVFVYDYLDRLCEVHQDPGYVPNSSSSSSSSARKSASKSNPKTAPSLKQVRTFLGSTRKLDLATVSLKSGIGAYNTREAKRKTSSQTQNASAPSGYVLKALYGYDPNNRRIYRGLADPAPYGEEWWCTYDGWQVQEEWQNYNMAGLLVAMKVNFVYRDAYPDRLGDTNSPAPSPHDSTPRPCSRCSVTGRSPQDSWPSAATRSWASMPSLY